MAFWSQEENDSDVLLITSVVHFEVKNHVANLDANVNKIKLPCLKI